MDDPVDTVLDRVENDIGLDFVKTNHCVFYPRLSLLLSHHSAVQDPLCYQSKSPSTIEAETKNTKGGGLVIKGC